MYWHKDAHVLPFGHMFPSEVAEDISMEFNIENLH
jgi:hypothetical protein